MNTNTLHYWRRESVPPPPHGSGKSPLHSTSQTISERLMYERHVACQHASFYLSLEWQTSELVRYLLLKEARCAAAVKQKSSELFGDGLVARCVHKMEQWQGRQQQCDADLGHVRKGHVCQEGCQHRHRLERKPLLDEVLYVPGDVVDPLLGHPARVVDEGGEFEVGLPSADAQQKTKDVAGHRAVGVGALDE
ncbi:hypothetical protein EYF80_010375 [Liparis tanakae]|uniref:Uncharacterized protein n=1 Tax=Liparis tanakae TaxID=230148 RepID=A0A4Z2INI3_9TELE|nr:hypothetical protein EYF80_010375 [Liparis tanakae]